MKHMKWLALLTAIVMMLGMGAAMGEPEHVYVSPSNSAGIHWVCVPWEDKGIDVWFGLNDSDDQFGYDFTFDILEQTSDEWKACYAKLDEDTKQLADASSLMLLNIGCDPVSSDVKQNQFIMYIQYVAPWQGANAFGFEFIGDGADDPYTVSNTLLTFTPDESESSFPFHAVTMKHFSPFAAYVEGDPVAAPVAPPSGSVPSTGDHSAPAMWLALAAMSAAAVIGFGRKARKA